MSPKRLRNLVMKHSWIIQVRLLNGAGIWYVRAGALGTFESHIGHERLQRN
jgi:hypothetical protein